MKQTLIATTSLSSGKQPWTCLTAKATHQKNFSPKKEAPARQDTNGRPFLKSPQPMMVISTDTAYYYDRVNHVIMSLVWLVLINGNIPAIEASLICLQMMKFFQQTGFGKSKTYFGGINYLPYMMGLSQGNRAAPPSWIQLSAIIVTVFKQLNLGAIINDPISDAIIHSMAALFVDDTNMYTWREYIVDPGELWAQTQIKIKQWSCLLNTTGGALKPEKCFWYLLDQTYSDGKWSYTGSVPRELLITNPSSSKIPIKQ
jgi:hypothetical protein